MSNDYVNDRLAQIVSMGRNGIPSHVKKLKIKSTLHHDYMSPMLIEVEMHNGKKFCVQTSGDDRLGDIVDSIARLV